jgi:hypothetical protein
MPGTVIARRWGRHRATMAAFACCRGMFSEPMLSRWCRTIVMATLAATCSRAHPPPVEPEAGQRFAGATDGVWYWRLPERPDGTRPVQSWSGAGTGPEGEIYIGGMDHATNTALYRLEPGGDAAPGATLRYVGDARSASRAAGNWRPAEVAEKFHTRPAWDGSRVYVATLSHSNLDDGYRQRRGFHWYAYDTGRDAFQDLSAGEPGGVAAPEVGVVSIVADRRRHLIYGVSQPTGDLYRYDIAAGRTTRLGRPAYGRPYVYVGRALWLDRQGRLYLTAGNPATTPAAGGPYDPAIFDHVHRFDPATGRFEELETWRLRETCAVDAAQCFPTAGLCYLCDNAGNVYRFAEHGPDGPAWSHVGSIDPGAGRNWLFQVSPRGEEAYLLATEGRFFAMDLPSGRISRHLDLFALEPSLRGLQLYGYDAWDRQGRFYFAAFGRPSAAFDARLVAIDPARFLAAAPTP